MTASQIYKLSANSTSLSGRQWAWEVGLGKKIHSDEGNKFANMFTQGWSCPTQENYMHGAQIYRVIGNREV